jgi:energy-coupling factor transport system ATP-binding protein
MRMYKLELKNISYLYSKNTPFEKLALSDVSVGFEAGKITGLIGHTGSGKSTLVNLLNGLYRPTEGTVLLDGKDIWEKPKEIAKIRTEVGLVMQYPEYQLFDETVKADIGFAPRNLGLDDAEIEKRVAEAVAFTGIPEELLDKSPFELSGGQKRRVAIAGVMAMGSSVLVLDEPAAGLDPRGRREILEVFAPMRKRTGSPLFWSAIPWRIWHITVIT